RASNAQYQFTLQGDDVRELNEWAPKVLKKIRTLPGLADVNIDQQNKGLQTSLRVDRDTAGRLGITQAAVDATLYDAFGQRQVSTMYTPLNQYHVVMEAAPPRWRRFTSSSGSSTSHSSTRSRSCRRCRRRAWGRWWHCCCATRS